MADKSKSVPTYPKFNSPRPDFTDPPVTEVVLSLQFDPINGFDTPHHGLIWDLYRKKYPRTSTKETLGSAIEDFGLPKLSPSVQFKVVQQHDVPRCWFENLKGTELIQVQPDRFIFNWKSGKVGEKYPRYERVRARFRSHFKTFETFLKVNGLGKAVPNQCEVTYVNEIYPGKAWKTPGQLGRIFTVWSGRYSDTFLSKPEIVNFNHYQRILSYEGMPIGRFHTSVESRIRISDGEPMLRFTLTARGAPLKPTKKAVFDFFNLGREYVVRGFASATTKKMHEVWGRTDV